MVNKFGEGRVFVVGGKDTTTLYLLVVKLIQSMKMLLMCTAPLEGRYVKID